MNILSGNKFTAILYVHAACSRAEDTLSCQIEDRRMAAIAIHGIIGNGRQAGGITSCDGYGYVAAGGTSFGVSTGDREEEDTVWIPVLVPDGGDIPVNGNVKPCVRLYRVCDGSFIVAGQH